MLKYCSLIRGAVFLDTVYRLIRVRTVKVRDLSGWLDQLVGPVGK